MEMVVATLYADIHTNANNMTWTKLVVYNLANSAVSPKMYYYVQYVHNKFNILKN